MKTINCCACDLVQWILLLDINVLLQVNEQKYTFLLTIGTPNKTMSEIVRVDGGWWMADENCRPNFPKYKENRTTMKNPNAYNHPQSSTMRVEDMLDMYIINARNRTPTHIYIYIYIIWKYLHNVYISNWQCVLTVFKHIHLLAYIAHDTRLSKNQ